MKRLPVLISIVHGGNIIPPELKEKIKIGKKEIFEDIDPVTKKIYDLNEKVISVFKTNIARTFVDLNRSPDDLPPKNPDGVVKSHTCLGKKIYKENSQPDGKLIDLLLKKYYHPYHIKLKNSIEKNKNEILLCLDCHSMAETGPAISPDKGMKRPIICLGNRFGDSATNNFTEKLKTCFINSFELNEQQVSINKPFAGGFITRFYGNNPLPWIQVEMNRALYLREPYFNSTSLKVSNEIVRDLNHKFYIGLKNFFP